MAGVAGCGNSRAVRAGGRSEVIVLGFDGMDYHLTAELMARGKLPHFARLAREGIFAPLGTSIPPQSPVAWSSFITGMDAGGHGIFDFLHRDPATLLPFFSTSRTSNAEKNLKLGKWKIPLESGKVELLRRGQPFWEVLEAHGIPASILRIPADFPPSGTASRELSGMGTPDILGTYGTFSLYTSDASPFARRRVSGGEIYPVTVVDGVVNAQLHGPDNPFLVNKQPVAAGFTVYLDPGQAAAKIVVGEEERILQEGEWSDWVPLDFDLIPTQGLRVMGRFYLKEVRPTFQLYVTPLNLDPFDPAMPISHPASYAAQLAAATGRYYTQGMPEDTKALSAGVFTPAEFLEQAHLAGEETIRQYRYVLGQFHQGLLFSYFGNVDQVSHMMWRSMDPDHPAYDAAVDGPFRNAVEDVYVDMDGVVGDTLEQMDPGTTLIVMSDHGFTSWRRAFHLNAWLRENGYLTVLDPGLRKDPGLLANVDWSGTRAYGLGINGLYINLRGRERDGIVDESERQALMDEIVGKLLKTVDPKTGLPAITRVFQREKAYKDRGALGIGPDLIVGYTKGTRGSNESALGEVPPDMFTDNMERWSGDHCMDPQAVPGILLANHPLKKPATRLEDLAAAVLAEFGIDRFPVQE